MRECARSVASGGRVQPRLDCAHDLRATLIVAQRSGGVSETCGTCAGGAEFLQKEQLESAALIGIEFARARLIDDREEALGNGRLGRRQRRGDRLCA